MIDNGGTITLAGDYNADDGDKALVVPEGTKVTLDLNGHTIDRGLAEAEAEEDGNVITVNGKLTIKDSSKEKTGTITGGRNNDYGGGVLIDEGASLVMDGGTISGNSADKYDGGGVSMENGAKEFIMNGGTITENSADSDGGGAGPLPQRQILPEGVPAGDIRDVERAHAVIGHHKHMLAEGGKCKGEDSALVLPRRLHGGDGEQHGRQRVDKASRHIPADVAPFDVPVAPVQERCNVIHEHYFPVSSNSSR